jgi:hypothetical protein
MPKADHRLLDCIRAWHAAEHGHAVSGAISAKISELIRAQKDTSDAADAIAEAAEEYGSDSAETEVAINRWLDALGGLSEKYQTLVRQVGTPRGEPSGSSTPSAPAMAGAGSATPVRCQPTPQRRPVAQASGLPPRALVVGQRAAGTGALSPRPRLQSIPLFTAGMSYSADDEDLDEASDADFEDVSRTPSFMPSWPASAAYMPTTATRAAPRPIPILPFRGLGRVRR